ncbi:hypothetical protein OV450_1330 [Actinobacteria bacterium OV450]|nr:hypothetical protein OV450_1330 [Actinobacteria bacterium OV450]
MHHHAYSYTGRSYSDGAIRKGEAPSNYPPIEIRHWLNRPASQIVATFTDAEAALAWLRAEMQDQPPKDEAEYSVEDRLRGARTTLAQSAGNDVVLGYYLVGGQVFVSRAVIACPRRERLPAGEAPIRCPQNRP